MNRPWWLRLAGFSLPYWKGLAGIFLLTIVGVAFQALTPWPLKLLVDYVFPGYNLPASLSWLNQFPGGNSAVGLCAWLALCTLLIFIGFWVIDTLKAYIQSGFAQRITYGLGGKAFEHLQRLSLHFHNRKPAGDLVRRVIGDSSCANDLVQSVFSPGLTSLVTLFTLYSVMWNMDRFLSFIVLLIIPMLMVFEKLFYKTMMECSYAQKQCEGFMMSQAEQTLSAMPVVQSFRRESYEKIQFRLTTDKTLKAYFRTLSAQLKFGICIGGTTATGRAVVLILGGFRVLHGDLTIGDLLIFLSYVDMLYTPMNTLAHLAGSLAVCQAGARRVFEILDTNDVLTEPKNKCSCLPKEGFKGHIKYDKVYFGYDPEKFVLQNINLEIQPGETVALIGQTGAGKTTLVSLLLRLFDPIEGRIEIDGIDIKTLQLSELRSQIAILLQEPFLLPLTIFENIAYGRPHASKQEVMQAAVAANADSFINKLPNAYDTVIGERGMTLSGGEKQRIAIARAILKNSPILILDEPTSALDARTEDNLIQALKRLMKGRTTLIIAHRLSTIRSVDRVVVLNQGRIIKQGTPQEV